LFNTLETVVTETPALSATSLMVGICITYHVDSPTLYHKKVTR
jgi:hypothetical protein